MIAMRFVVVFVPNKNVKRSRLGRSTVGCVGCRYILDMSVESTLYAMYQHVLGVPNNTIFVKQPSEVSALKVRCSVDPVLYL